MYETLITATLSQVKALYKHTVNKQRLQSVEFISKIVFISVSSGFLKEVNVSAILSLFK